MREGAWSLHVTMHAEADAAAVWSNMPAAATLLFGSHRHVQLVDLYGMSKVRLKVNKQTVAGAAASKLVLRYSPIFSLNVGDYIDIGAAEVSVPVDVQNSFLDSGWLDLGPTVPRDDDVFLAIVGIGGNGALDPQFGSIAAAFA